MWAYCWGFVRSFLGNGALWWYTLILTYFFGVGFFTDYVVYRDKINLWQDLVEMPEHFPFWLVVVPFLLWVILKLTHDKVMSHNQAARLVFDAPHVDRAVPLFGPVERVVQVRNSDGEYVLQKERIRGRVGSNDIAKIVVRNCPYELENGKSVRDAYVSVTFFDAVTEKQIEEVEYPRWEENPKPGYQGNPSDHFPYEWNMRDLSPNQSRNTIGFVLKDFEEKDMFGFCGGSQLVPLWRDKNKRIPPGTYLVRICIFGVGLKKEAETWLKLENKGKGHTIEVERTRERVSRRWF